MRNIFLTLFIAFLLIGFCEEKASAEIQENDKNSGRFDSQDYLNSQEYIEAQKKMYGKPNRAPYEDGKFALNGFTLA